MTWFKVDDKHHDHKKTRRALRGVPGKRRDAGAMGLWELAGSWSADNLMDGFVPADELFRWDDDWEVLAQRLVDAGYWEPTERDGEPGFQFINWEEHQPTKTEVEAKREAAKERMRNLRSGLRARSGEVRANTSRSDAARSQPRPVPSRPDSEEADASSSAAPAAAPKKPAATRGTRRPDDFRPTEAHVALASERGVDLAEEWTNFCDWCDANGKTYKDWSAALRTWIRRARPSRQPSSQPSNVQRHLALAQQLADEEQAQMIPFPQLEGGSR